MNLKKLMNEMEEIDDSFLDDGQLFNSKNSVSKDGKLSDKLKVYQSLKNEFDEKFAKEILVKWKQSGKEDLKDFLVDIINAVRKS